MKYKYIPEPTLAEDEQKKPLHRKENDVLIIGWEIGKMVGEEGHEEYQKLREVMTLSEQDEVQWQWEQSHKEPSHTDVIEAQVTYTAMMTDTLLEV